MASQSFSISQIPSRDYTFDPITVTLRDDMVAEGNETIAVRIIASGNVFENGSNSTVVRITLRDNDFAGGAGNDILTGSQYNENFTGGGGADVINAGGGFDVALFEGTPASTSVGFRTNGTVIVSGADGLDTLTGVEQLRIGGQVLDVASAAPIGNVYQMWGGRDAGASELGYWIGEIGAGRATTGSIKAVILADPLGKANTEAVVGNLYRDYLGRTADGGELAFWGGQVRAGTTFDDIRGVLVAEPAGQANTAAVVATLYSDYIGRSASDAELAYWNGQVRAGTDFSDVRSALVEDASGRNNIAARVDGLYDQYIGRDASAGEVAFWTNEIRQGADFGAVRAALLADASGRAHTSATVAGLYAELIGRQPTAGEQIYWAGQVTAGTDFATVRSALANDASGRAHVAGVIDTVYRDYGGRSATADEVAYWDGQVRGGTSLAGVRDAVLDDQLGTRHTTQALDGLYTALFGRGALSSEQGAWHELLHEGFTLDTARSTLSFDAGSGERVTKVAGAARSDTFAFSSTSHHLAVTGFDPAQDVVDLRGFDLTGATVLDQAHAREVRSLDGGTDVLITIDAQTDVLLKSISLAQLNAGDFLI